MKIAKLITLSAVILATSALTSAVASAQDVTDFDTVLAGIDSTPNGAQLEAAYPDIRERLMDAAVDEGRSTYVRSRAITFLSYYPEPRVKDFLVGLGSSETLEVRRLAVYTLGRGFGHVGDAELVSFVMKFTEDKAPRVRMHAVRALRWIEHPSAEDALRQIASGQDAELAGLAKVTLSRRR